MKRPYHIYECGNCVVTFAVEQAFEDQAILRCPSCYSDDHLRDVGHGEMIETHYPVEGVEVS